MAMTDEEREERAEQRSKDRRVERIQKVWAALSRTQYQTAAQLAVKTGMSAPLVRSTLNLIRLGADDVNGEPLSYDYRAYAWKIADSWPEAAPGFRWKVRHVVTRLNRISAELDVMVATWPGKVPTSMQIFAWACSQLVKQADTWVEVEPTPIPGVKATRPPTLHG